MSLAMQEAPLRLLYSVAEAAKILGVSRATTFREIRAKRLKPRRIGRRTMLAAEELRRYAEAAD